MLSYYFNIYNSMETDFTHNEYCFKDILNPVITEEINGVFNLEFNTPLGAFNSEYLIRGNIIKSRVPGGRQDQLFRINNINRTLKEIKVSASCIGIDDLSRNFIKDTNIVAKNKVQAVRQILENTMEDHHFTVEGDENSADFENLRIVRYNPINAIFGSDDNTIVNRFGGEYQFDNFKIKVANQLGSDNGVTIHHAKNLESIEESINDDELITAIIPQGDDELLIPEYVIYSDKVNNYEKIYYSNVKFDIGVDEENGITEKMAIDQLRESAKKLFEVEQVDRLFFNYSFNLIDLRKTEEYKNYVILEDVEIGDTVTIKSKKLIIDLVGRVYKYTYNPLTDRYISLEIGVKKPDITMTINDTNKSISKTEEQIEMKVGAGDVHTLVTQNATSWGLSINGKLSGKYYNFDGENFTIGSSSGSTRAYHNNERSKWVHSSDGYSEVNATGLYRNGRPYHSCMTVGTGVSGGLLSKTVTVNLPSEFKGKDFKVIVSTRTTSGGEDSEVVKRIELHIQSIDKTAGTFTVSGEWVALNSANQRVSKELEWTYTAIGG